MVEENPFFLPEWVEQDAVVLIWPTGEMDWDYILEEVEECYSRIVRAITAFQPVVLLCSTDPNTVLERIGEIDNLHIVTIPAANDTWARDLMPLSLYDRGKKVIVDFGFNGWGLKYSSNHDNVISRYLFAHHFFNSDVQRRDQLHFILEGGAVEVNSRGELLTTQSVLMERNRNPHLCYDEQEQLMVEALQLAALYCIEARPFEGDDTDGHIDTLARFLDDDTIVYQTRSDGDNSLRNALEMIRNKKGDAYKLLPLPAIKTITDPDDDTVLPATYANFLYVNNGLIVPTYGVDTDQQALEVLRNFFGSERKVVGVDCSPLIRQHGSLHCITMQFPRGFLNPKIFEQTICELE